MFQLNLKSVVFILSVLSAHLAFIYASPWTPTSESLAFRDASPHSEVFTTAKSHLSSILSNPHNPVAVDHSLDLPLEETNGYKTQLILNNDNLRHYEKVKNLGDGMDGTVDLHRNDQGHLIAVKTVAAKIGMEENHLSKKLGLVEMKPEMERDAKSGKSKVKIPLKYIDGKTVYDSLMESDSPE